MSPTETRYGIEIPHSGIPGPKQRPIRILDLSLHQAVTHDILATLRTLYGDTIEYINWNISQHNFFNAPDVDIQHINSDTWIDIDETSMNAFRSTYASFLQTVDLFIVGHVPVLSMVFEPFGKPILVLNTCRYDQPYCWYVNQEKLEVFKIKFKEMVARGQCVVVSNNRADQLYLKENADIESIYIPSLCLYTEPHTPITSRWMIYSRELEERLFSINNADTYLQKRPEVFSWENVRSAQGIVHLPYETSSMSMFEQYFAGIPLLVPSPEFLLECIRTEQIEFIVRYDLWGTKLSDEEILKWIKNADYYSFPHIRYYTSFEDCIQQITSFKDTSREERLRDIDCIKTMCLNVWKDLLDPILQKLIDA